MIGPTQLVLIGTDGPEIPAAICQQVERLRAAGTVCLLDALSLHKNLDGTVDSAPAPELMPDAPRQPGELIGQLLAKAGAAAAISAPPPAGRGWLLCGDPIPTPEDALPSRAMVLALLIEHKWAIPLRDTVREVDAFPVGDAWLGREVLREVQLIGEND